MTKMILVSVVIPCRNEANTIASVLEDLANQNVKEPYEVMVADGLSDDGTWNVLKAHEAKRSYPYQMRLLRNRLRRTPHALNLLVANAVGEYIVRIDGHSRNSQNYLNSIVAMLKM